MAFRKKRTKDISTEIPLSRLATPAQISSYIKKIVNAAQYDSFETEAFEVSSCFALRRGYAHYGDLFIVSAGNPFGITGTTNMMVVENIGDVLVRGTPTKGDPITANITHVLASDLKRKHNVKGKIAVLSHCDDTLHDILSPAVAIVLQNLPEDTDSEKAARKIAKELNWQPEETFESGIRKTIQWYLDNQQWCKNVQDGSYQRERLGVTS